MLVRKRCYTVMPNQTYWLTSVFLMDSTGAGTIRNNGEFVRAGAYRYKLTWVSSFSAPGSPVVVQVNWSSLYYQSDNSTSSTQIKPVNRKALGPSLWVHVPVTLTTSNIDMSIRPCFPSVERQGGCAEDRNSWRCCSSCIVSCIEGSVIYYW